jgi:HTH-type transcriptional regulator/antitoxin HigA
MQPPGEFIKEELVARGWSVHDLARNASISLRTAIGLTISEVKITAPIAQSLSAAFGTSAEFWTNLQEQFDASHGL